MAKAPQRIQRRRTKGWRMPPNTIYVGRPTKWGNPWQVGEVVGDEQFTAERCVEMFRATMCPMDVAPGWFTDFEMTGIDLNPLRGKNLACFCPLDQPCHADVLLELANG